MLQAAVILGSGSAGFEMLRYLTERPPVMLTPSWVQPRAEGCVYSQRAIFLPHGLPGHVSWWITWPVHVLVFGSVARRIARLRA